MAKNNKNIILKRQENKVIYQLMISQKMANHNTQTLNIKI